MRPVWRVGTMRSMLFSARATEVAKKKWSPATVTIKGSVEYAGSWSSPNEAAIARERLRLHHGRERHSRFAREARARGPASAEELRMEALRLSRADRATIYRGVYWDADREAWRADAYRADRSGYDIIGFFADDREAAVIRDRVMLHIHGRAGLSTLNFPNETLKPLALEAARKRARYQARTDKSSKYLGVDFRRGRWSAGITVDGEREHLGTFDEEVQAARAYDRAALFLKGPNAKLNFPLGRSSPASPEELRREGRTQRKATTTSRYLGVSWSESAQAWAANINVQDRHAFIGHFDDEQEAALAYDAVAREVLGPDARDRFNFPDRIIAPRSLDSIRAELWERFKSTCTSSYTGVSWSKVEEKWRANIIVDGLTHPLGAFDNEVDAARAYDEAALRLLGPEAHVNFPRRGVRSEPTPRTARRRAASP